MVDFQRVADDVHVLRYPVLDVNCVLVLGRDRALLVDTLSTAGQARELAAAVRRLTSSPVVVVNTHDHFDHWFGNHTIAEQLGAVDFWAHESAIAVDADHAESRAAARRACVKLAPEIADEVGDLELLTPNRPVTDEATIDLGGRSVRLWHPGRAHSHGDLIAFAGSVTIAGDLVEEGAPPSVGSDADAAHWSRVLERLAPMIEGPVIPGHGAIVDAAFVTRQAQQLAD
ncbi:MBL fold metallo-hydrolase [Stackebrandtia nassauensis]|uniref:MBL fold metallo-hydrolase n=1 Tax=Stackebrandtia nassauensis TaxID=283811 RepID=UPI0001A39EDE|nr:MBL fold metallo-hydrolase [Stackebrandtia nassauensis]